MPQNFDVKKTKEKIDKIMAQAKESVKVLDLLQKEGVAKARAVWTEQSKDITQLLSNDAVLATLKKLGLATRTEVRDLERKVEELASELRAQINQVSKASKKAKSKDKGDHADANA